MSYAHVIQVLHESLLGPFLEITTKSGRSQAYQSGDFLQLHWRLEVLLQIFIDLIETLEIVRPDFPALRQH